MEIARGDIVIVALAGDYGKARPAVVVQAAPFAMLPSITVLPLTSECHAEPLIRISVQPKPSNGLQQPSQIMVDKVSTLPRSKLGARVGHLDAVQMRQVDFAMARFLGIIGITDEFGTE